MNELAGQSLGGYQLEEEVGRGSMGVVYRGKQVSLGREVAIKVLPQSLARDASYVARFIREAHIIAGLNHPNIVQIYDAGQQNKLLYFVMEFVQGPTLASLLHLDGVIPQHLAADYAAQIADALDAAYKERDVIHRDIKPENLMLNRWGKIKVMDFGLARATGLQAITVAKTLVGSIYYASPEQIWGQTLDNRSDIYALGVVLYEMVCGHRPFKGRSMPELTQAIIGGPLLPPAAYNPALSPQLEQIILTALSRDRSERYAEANLMAEELRALDLQPPTIPLARHTSMPGQGSALTPFPAQQNGQPGRNRTIMRPPRRPQAQPPRYIDLNHDVDLHHDVENEPTQPLLNEALAGQMPETPSRRPAPPEQGIVTSLPPLQEVFFDKGPLVDVPTRPLQPVSVLSTALPPHDPHSHADAALPPLQKARAQQSFWKNQLLRLFKLSSRYRAGSTSETKTRKSR